MQIYQGKLLYTQMLVNYQCVERLQCHYFFQSSQSKKSQNQSQFFYLNSLIHKQFITFMINNDFTSLSIYRNDGRKENQLRQTNIQLGIDPNYDGSCLYRQGLTQVLCLVNGPLQRANPNDNLLKIEYTVAPFSSIEKRTIKFDKEFSQFTESIRKSFEGIIIADTYSKSIIEVIVTVIQNEGSAKSCVMNSITLALTNAGICMKDLLISCTIAKQRQNQYLIDINEEEQYDTSNEIIVSYLQQQNKMDYFELRKAKLKEEELRKMYQIAIKGCEQLYKRIKKALIDYAHKRMLVF